jgi:hypothetical protein
MTPLDPLNRGRSLHPPRILAPIFSEFRNSLKIVPGTGRGIATQWLANEMILSIKTLRHSLGGYRCPQNFSHPKTVSCILFIPSAPQSATYRTNRRAGQGEFAFLLLTIHLALRRISRSVEERCYSGNKIVISRNVILVTLIIYHFRTINGL